MDLRQLNSFIGIAETGSLTRAATKVWLSQSALSRQMQELEEELGVRLFDRQARGVQLTEAGRYVLDRSRALVKDAEALRSGAAAMGNEPSGALCIGAPPSLRSMLIASFAVPFLRRYPRVQLQIREGTSRDMRDALSRGDVDLAVVSSVEPLESFRQTPVLEESLWLVGPPQARLVTAKPVPVTRLKDLPLILTPYPNSLRQIVDSALARHKIRRDPVAEADMVSMMLDLVRRGLGHTVLAYCAIHEELQTRSISASPIRGLKIEWVICQSRERPETAAIRAARGALLDTAMSQWASGQWLLAKPSASARKER
jgi:LysR family nitrogen assimilation transcriptional regulator